MRILNAASVTEALVEMTADNVDFELEEPAVTRPMGRPPGAAHDRERAKTIRALEEHQRARLLGLGLTCDQLIQGIAYCTKGYTVEAAAKLVLAGGMRRGLFS